MSSNLVALIIGSGSNVGASVAQTLARNSYKVAVGSRQIKLGDSSEYYPFAVDITKPETVKAAFKNVTAALGPPNVVIFNAATFTPPKADDPLSLPYETYANQANCINSFYIAAQEAVKAFRADVHKDSPKVFITTGNMLAFLPASMPSWLGLGLQKRSNAYLTELPVFSTAYIGEGIRYILKAECRMMFAHVNASFHYAHYVAADGGIPALSPDAPESFFQSGPIHAEVYWHLICSSTLESWDYRFTWDGKKFDKNAK